MLGKVIGFHRGMDTLGAVAGPLLALLLLSCTGGNLRLVLWLAVIAGVLAALILAQIKSLNLPMPVELDVRGNPVSVGK